ncbi:MAG: hypothetical protein Q8N63_08000 [Nanoarchaeota archaeon]|nr:hypothetical protein [Nanoarchaeota archaeon]
MGKILMFRPIGDLTFNNDIENLVLFGEENFVDDSEEIYDLIFHSKQIANPYEQKKPCSLVIPVLRTFNKTEAYKMIRDLNKAFPDFDRFAVSGEFLDFYQTIKERGKTRLKGLGKYNVVDYAPFIAHSEDPFFEQNLERKIREINEHYK